LVVGRLIGEDRMRELTRTLSDLVEQLPR